MPSQGLQQLEVGHCRCRSDGGRKCRCRPGGRTGPTGVVDARVVLVARTVRPVVAAAERHAERIPRRRHHQGTQQPAQAEPFRLVPTAGPVNSMCPPATTVGPRIGERLSRRSALIGRLGYTTLHNYTSRWCVVFSDVTYRWRQLKVWGNDATVHGHRSWVLSWTPENMYEGSEYVLTP